INLPLVFVSIMTFVLIMSSVTMVLAVHAGHNNDKKSAAKWMIWTIIGGFIFLACQAWEWTHLYHEGAWWGKIPAGEHFLNRDGSAPNTAFSNFFFTITGFHGFHVFSGIIINIIILINILKGTYERRGHYEMVEKAGLYWHFVDLVWVFVFTCFYLL
ncbi:MAG TPA: cytochrome c oxidase subunit 3, partial [Chitinophagaceae bacterium]|nr:cytochrome c oxidase subunit 3 [Chitinophagaceae bacterium]